MLSRIKKKKNQPFPSANMKVTCSHFTRTKQIKLIELSLIKQFFFFQGVFSIHLHIFSYSYNHYQNSLLPLLTLCRNTIPFQSRIDLSSSIPQCQLIPIWFLTVIFIQEWMHVVKNHTFAYIHVGVGEVWVPVTHLTLREKTACCI